MTKLKYKDENGFWQEFQVGTNVVANPTLTGTEQELTSLQVGNAKYKSGGGGKLYNHAIYYFISETDLSVYINVITSSSTPFTQFSEFKSLIENKVAIITGPEFCGAAAAITTVDEVWIRGGGAMGSDTTTYATIDKKLSGSNFTDTVKEL